MATAEILRSGSLSPATALILERSTSKEVVAVAPIDATKNNRRIMLSAMSPLLIKTSRSDISAEVQELLVVLPPEVLQDPKTKATLDSLLTLLRQCEEGSGDPATVAKEAKTAIDQGFALIEKNLTDGSESAPGESPFDQVLKMVGLMMKMLILVSTSQNLQAQNQVDFLDKVKATLNDVMNQMKQKILDQIQAAREAREQSFWAKLGGIILGAFLTVVTGIFLGPAAACIVAALFIMQQTGTTDKIFSGIDNPTAKMFAKIGFALAVGVAGGGLAGALDYGTASMAANAADSAAGAAVEDAATVAADDAVAAEVDNLGANATEESLENAAPKPWEAFKAGGWGNFKSIANQALFSTDPVTDFINMVYNPGKDPDKKKKALWISFGMNLALVAASGKMASSGTESSFTVQQMGKGFNDMVQKADGLLQKSLAYTLYYAAKLARNSLFVGAGTLGLSGFVAYHQYKLGDVYDTMADNTRAQSDISAAQGRAQDLIAQANTEFQQAAEFESNLAKAILPVNVSNMTNQGWEVSEILA